MNGSVRRAYNNGLLKTRGNAKASQGNSTRYRAQTVFAVVRGYKPRSYLIICEGKGHGFDSHLALVVMSSVFAL